MMSFEITEVTSSLMIMTAGEDGTSEGSVWGDVDTTFVHEDMVSILPVRETRPEGSRDVLQGQL